MTRKRLDELDELKNGRYCILSNLTLAVRLRNSMIQE